MEYHTQLLDVLIGNQLHIYRPTDLLTYSYDWTLCAIGAGGRHARQRSVEPDHLQLPSYQYLIFANNQELLDSVFKEELYPNKILLFDAEKTGTTISHWGDTRNWLQHASRRP